MSNPSKAKGTAFETAVAEYLGIGRNGAIYGAKDRGDHADPYWTIEDKAEKTIRLAEYMSELEREMSNAGKRLGAVVIKRRRGKGSDGSTGSAYVVMPLYVFRRVRGLLSLVKGDISGNL